MPKLSHSELNSIREVVSSHQTSTSKLATYAKHCTDPHIKQLFAQAAQEAQESAQNLISLI